MKALAVFTNRGVGTLVDDGGSQAWALDPERARRTTVLVCAQNRDNGDWGKPTHAQRQGFLLAKISAVEPSPEGRDGLELDDYGIDPTKLTFRRVPAPEGESPPPELKQSPASATGPLDIQSAKKALAAFYQVPPASIEIMIRG